MTKIHRSRKGYLWGDPYAAYALGIPNPRRIPTIGEGIIESAVQAFTHLVFPPLASPGFVIKGDDAGAVKTVNDILLDRDIWAHHDMASEFRAYVEALLTQQDLYVYFALEDLGPEIGVVLLDLKWLAPETVVDLTGGDYEQYVSPRATEGEGYQVSGGPREYYFTFSAEEILHLRASDIDFAEAPSSRKVLQRLSRRIDRLQDRHLLALSAAAYPTETFWTVVRGRVGGYSDALEQLNDLEAIAHDKVFVIPQTELTEYFTVDRVTRSHLAALTVREYIIDSFNAQILGRWCRLNGWSETVLSFESNGWAREDWLELRRSYSKGTASFEDVNAAILAEHRR